MSGIKVFDPFPRKAGTSLAEFSHYWITFHGELAKRFLQIRHYVQSLRLEDKPEALGGPLGDTWCDGCAETWYDDAGAVQEMVQAPHFDELMDDETKFMELGQPRFLLTTEEHVLDSDGFDTRQRGVKVLVFARRPVGADRAGFITAWGGDDSVALGRRLGVTRHVACATLDEAEEVGHPNTSEGSEESAAREDAPYDAVRELWWSDLDAIRRASEREPDAFAELVRPSVVDAPRSFALVAHERIIVP